MGDLEKTGWLSSEKLTTSLENVRISAFFEHLEVDFSKVEVLVRLLDLDGNGRITKEEFISGIVKLAGRGGAHPEEVADTMLEEQRLHAKLDDLKELICQHHELLVQAR